MLVCMGSSSVADTGIAPPGATDDGVREALVTLRRPKGKTSELLTPQTVDTLVSQVQEQTGLQGEVAGVMGSLRSFRVRASERFLKALADAPMVAKVQAFESFGSAKIEPINRCPIDLPD